MTLQKGDTFDLERWEDDGGQVTSTNSDAELMRMLKTQAADIEDRDMEDSGDPFEF